MPAFTSENGIRVMRMMDSTSRKAEIATLQAAANTLHKLSTMMGNRGSSILAAREGEHTGSCAFRYMDEVLMVAVEKMV